MVLFFFWNVESKSFFEPVFRRTKTSSDKFECFQCNSAIRCSFVINSSKYQLFPCTSIRCDGIYESIAFRRAFHQHWSSVNGQTSFSHFIDHSIYLCRRTSGNYKFLHSSKLSPIKTTKQQHWRSERPKYPRKKEEIIRTAKSVPIVEPNTFIWTLPKSMALNCGANTKTSC